MPSSERARPKVRLAFALSSEEKLKVERYAQALGVTPSELAREAVAELIFKLESPSTETVQEEESELAERMKKLENRLAALLAKLTRASAQTLYFSTLPYLHGGLPKEPLPEGAMKALWFESRNFAGQWLKRAMPASEQEEALEIDQEQGAQREQVDSEGGQ